MTNVEPIFLIYAHTDPRMLGILVRALQPYRVVVHIDLKSEIEPFLDEAADLAEFTQSRVPVYWADYSQVEAMRVLVSHVADADPRAHLVLLSGQDFPVRPISSFARYLSEHPGQQFAHSFRIRDSEMKYFRQVNRRHYRAISPRLPLVLRRSLMKALELFARYPSPRPPEYLTVCHGQAHWVLTNECAQELLSSVPDEVARFFRRSFAPDEKIVPSLLESSRFAAEEHHGGPVRYVGPGNWRYTNFHYVDKELRALTEADLPAVLESGKYFARKITSGTSSELLRLLSSHIAESGSTR